MQERLFINASFVFLFFHSILQWAKPMIPFLTEKKGREKGARVLRGVLLRRALLWRWWDSHHFPLSNLYESLVFLTLLLTLRVLQLETFGAPSTLLPTASLCPLLVIRFASFALPVDLQRTTALVPALKSNWLVMHVTVMMISYAGLLIGSLFSVFYLGRRSTHRTVVKRVFLKRLDQTRYRLITFAFPFLTLGILSGAVWANETWGSYWSWDPKETWSLILWLRFAAYLHTRLVQQKEGSRPAKLAAFGFFLVWICYLGVNLLGKGLHSYGWFLALKNPRKFRSWGFLHFLTTSGQSYDHASDPRPRR